MAAEIHENQDADRQIDRADAVVPAVFRDSLGEASSVLDREAVQEETRQAVLEEARKAGALTQELVNDRVGDAEEDSSVGYRDRGAGSEDLEYMQGLREGYGHGPQRHHDPDNGQLRDRMGRPKTDPETGDVVLKANGQVKAEAHIDPMTGTTTDAQTGGPHYCGAFSTRIDSAADYVVAEKHMRSIAKATEEKVVERPIADVLGVDGHRRCTGYYRHPASPHDLQAANFEGGTIVAFYQLDTEGSLTLLTMYPNPEISAQREASTDQ